jgi:hypothetical protein
MMQGMRRGARSLVLALVGLSIALGACEPESWLQASGMRAFRQLEPDEARRILADPEVFVIEVREPGTSASREIGLVIGESEALPPVVDEIVAEARRIVVVAPEVEPGRRVSARLVRAGASRVGLVVIDPRELGGETRRARLQPSGG